MEELPAYTPSGKGEHLFVTFTKTGLTTDAAVRSLAHALGVDPRGAGHAGMKDRHAVTTQTISLPVPIARQVEAEVAALRIEGITVLDAIRHENKLKPGHLKGNRFTIRLRELSADDAARIAERLAATAKRGVPNRFGPQRFGRDGSNATRTLAWIRGDARPPRDSREQRFLFSSLQSKLFNDVLDARVADDSWFRALPGDLAKKTDTGGMFLVPFEGPELDDARARAEAGDVAPTGPMFGASMRWPEGAPQELERRVLAAAGLEAKHLEAVKKLGEGTRRSLVLPVEGLSVHTEADPLTGAFVVTTSLVLGKGGYATTVLGEACDLVDATRRDAPRGVEPETQEPDPE